MIPDDNELSLKSLRNFNSPLRSLLMIALIFVILVGMNATSYLINMFVLSLILAMIGTPLLYMLKKRGLSDILSVTLIMSLYAVILVLFIYLMYESFFVLISSLPKYNDLLEIRLADLDTLLGGFGINPEGIINLSDHWGLISNILVMAAGDLSSLVMNGFFIFVTTGFLLLEIPALPKRFEKISNGDGTLSERYHEMCESMITWLVVKTKTNLVLGASFGGLLFVLGVDLALFWAILAVVLSYIPYIGFIIVAIPAIILAWLELGIEGVIVLIVGICIINAVVENVVFSKFAATGFNMPPILVVLSLILWTWILGPVGMLISVPFTLMILIAFRYNESTQWISTMFGLDDEAD